MEVGVRQIQSTLSGPPSRFCRSGRAVLAQETHPKVSPLLLLQLLLCATAEARLLCAMVLRSTHDLPYLETLRRVLLGLLPNANRHSHERQVAQ
jgi:hypothetical protein